MPSILLCVILFRLHIVTCVNTQEHHAIPERKKPINFFKVTKNRNEVSVYHRIGHACDLSKDCQQSASRDQNSLVQQSTTLEMDADIEIKSEPFSGMTLFVHQDDHAADAVQNFGVEKRSSGDINLYHQQCCQAYKYMHSQNPRASPNDHHKKYELVEVLQEDLGSKNIYNHDFAYRPVVALPSSAHERWRDDEYWWDNQNHNEYEKLGNRAFAGGSHGEVWRAKRRCYQVVVNLAAQTQGFSDYRHRHEQKPICIEGEGLIMKRLKVGKSYALMEAGLREIYFGDILSRNDESASLFTTYVDHFFRRGPGGGIDNLELWIVFKDAGPSLRSYLYSPVDSGDFVVYQHSAFWTQLRTGKTKERSEQFSSSLVALVASANIFTDETEKMGEDSPTEKQDGEGEEEEPSMVSGKDMVKSILRQLLTSAAKLHERGIVHRDIKPSNIMCQAMMGGISPKNCVLGDFSSAYDEFTSDHLYSRGPSPAEQTDEYAPPEVLFSTSEWIPFEELKPESYDSWSIGVVILEMLLGTPNVFSVDKRTTAVLTKKLKDESASDSDIRRALYLAALSQFCIYIPTSSNKDWPLREGDPLFQASMAKTTCTMKDFHSALRARDPLGLGFSTSIDPLLHLIWGLLAWDPKERLTAADALKHFFFTDVSLSDDGRTTAALQHQTLDPRLDLNLKEEDLQEFTCPKCGRVFDNLQSCQMHAHSRKHAKFCEYDRSLLPKCLNAHSMLPSHPTSGYCDIQGRRKTIEDFHTVHLHDTHQFFGVFDGHNSNFASKYASAALYKRIVKPLSDVDDDIKEGRDWKQEVESEMTDAFNELHNGYLEAMKNIPSSSMREAGTTATALFITENAVIIASVGDSRAVLSLGSSFNSTKNNIDALQLTVDHVAANEIESQRVENLGGFVATIGGTVRVNGTLVLTRSIGDAHLAQYLSRTPHVISMTTNEVNEKCHPGSMESSDDLDMPCFIILASDGLWDVMSNREAVTFVTITVRRFGANWKEEGAFQEAAERLTQEAFVRGSTDNIGVAVVALV